MGAPPVQDNDMRLAQFVTHSHVKHHPLNREALEEMAKANEVCVLHTELSAQSTSLGIRIM
jgi:hypothetical protein